MSIRWIKSGAVVLSTMAMLSSTPAVGSNVVFQLEPPISLVSASTTSIGSLSKKGYELAVNTNNTVNQINAISLFPQQREMTEDEEIVYNNMLKKKVIRTGENIFELYS